MFRLLSHHKDVACHGCHRRISSNLNSTHRGRPLRIDTPCGCIEKLAGKVIRCGRAALSFIDDDLTLGKIHGHQPVLFIPGNAGSSHQVRSIASSAVRQYYTSPHQVSPEIQATSLRPIDMFTGLSTCLLVLPPFLNRYFASGFQRRSICFSWSHYGSTDSIHVGRGCVHSLALPAKYENHHPWPLYGRHCCDVTAAIS